jgi:hypothetical protein
VSGSVPLAGWLSVLAVEFVIEVLYLVTLQKALRQCTLQNRTMTPAMVWLQIVPLLGIVWWFVNVDAASQSLDNEYLSRGIKMRRSHQTIGRVAGWIRVGILVLVILEYGVISFAQTQESVGGDAEGNVRFSAFLWVVVGLVVLAFFVGWIMYWVEIWKMWRHVAGLAPVAPAPRSGTTRAARPAPATDFCRNCGLLAPKSGVCPRCGARQ